MVELRKLNFIGEVPLKDKPGGNVIGTAKLEVTKGGHVIAHIDAQDIPDAITRGFNLGSLSIARTGDEC